MAERNAEVTWQGDLLSGSGTIEQVGSGAFAPLPVTWAARAEDESGGKTSPEELIAAAHASCFSMAFAHGLAQAGTPPERLESSYRSVLREARRLGVRSIAFPSISTGVYGYPIERAAALAVRTVRNELSQEPGDIGVVRFVCFSEGDLRVYSEVLGEPDSQGLS